MVIRMKVAVSNIAWTNEQDEMMYDKLRHYDIQGLEIAPTRIFPGQPYEHSAEAADFAEDLQRNYALQIPSMQSIWFGQTGNIFAGDAERDELLQYTKKAILFAEAIRCHNLVFGCPRNRNMPQALTKTEYLAYYQQAVDFFLELAAFSQEHHTVLAMEANPPIYNTNFINTTKDACDIVRTVNHPGFRINLDIGTMIQNGEDARSIQLEQILPYVNHIHISEPGLKPIQRRQLHRQVLDILRDYSYSNFISLEMAKQDNIDIVEQCIQYVLQLTER